MNVLEIKDKKNWDNFYNKYGEKTFLQSWDWGVLQEKIGHQVLRLGVYQDDGLKSIAQVIKVRAARGNFLFIPHGPLSSTNSIYLKELLKYLSKIAKEENYLHIRIAPILENLPKNRNIFKKAGFKNAPTHMHAENIWYLDVSNSEEELISSMRKTTRYSIKKAQKEEVEIEKSFDQSAIGKFWKVYEKTVERENFTPFSKEFIKQEFESFNKDRNAVFLLGRLKGKPQVQSCALILFNKKTAFYHQGASLHNKIPVSYLLQWEAIKEAKNRGCKYYNFWGIAPNDNKNHPWYGLTLFKKGFGGKQIDYLKTQDFVVSKLYYLTFIYEKIVKWKRNL